METTPTPSHQSTVQLKLDWRIVSVVLLAVIITMLWLWKPWQATKSTKTISVQGSATLSQVPDSYLFSPLFQGTDVKAVTATGNEAVEKLKALGVKDSGIKTSVNSAERPIPLDAKDANISSSLIYPYPYGKSTYIITITVKDKTLAQKVADYLATTTATGQVTPQATLSKESRAALDLKARSQASDDAKSKAGVMAKQLGTKLGKVLSVTESSANTGYAYPAKGIAEDSSSPSAVSGGPTVEPGTDEVTYTATVVFELK